MLNMPSARTSCRFQPPSCLSATRLFVGAIQFDVGFNELDCAVSACGYGLRRCAGKPIDHRAAGYQARKNGAWRSDSFSTFVVSPFRQRHDDGEDHRRCAHHCRAISTGFAVALKVLLRAAFSSSSLGGVQIYVDVEVFLSSLDIGTADQRSS